MSSNYSLVTDEFPAKVRLEQIANLARLRSDKACGFPVLTDQGTHRNLLDDIGRHPLGQYIPREDLDPLRNEELSAVYRILYSEEGTKIIPSIEKFQGTRYDKYVEVLNFLAHYLYENNKEPWEAKTPYVVPSSRPLPRASSPVAPRVSS